jgi:hypothetical protein
MKQIINSKRYDTEKAAQLARWHNGVNSGDPKLCEEKLYGTKNGAFFIHGAGGAMSRWSKRVGNTTGAGEGIEVQTKDEAMNWLEEKGLTEELEEHFGDSIQDA